MRSMLCAVGLGFVSGCGAPADQPTMAAPVRAVAAAATAACPGTGGHSKHVLDLGVGCAVCHPKGAEYGFADAYAMSYPGGTTTRGGTITRGDGVTTQTTCTVGCHSPLGAPAHTVAWSAAGPLACTACHDTTTLAPAHPPVSPAASRADCQGCHLSTGHLGGAVTLVGHDASWSDTASLGFHAFAADRGLGACQTCHAQDLAGGVTGVACATCHDRASPPLAWKDNCVMCHGGTDNATGAPPRALWGQAADTKRVGAHTAHLTASTLSKAVACESCHPVPTDALSAGHIDAVTDPAASPMANLAFSGLATHGGTAPAWDRTAGTCTNTYCHGATLHDGSNTAPAWTRLDGTQAACGTCHGTPPKGLHPTVDPTAGLAACSGCHSATIDASGAMIPPASGGKHLDGTIEATGHSASWMDEANPAFHAYSANLSLDPCKSCHGATLDGGAGRACAACHNGSLPAGVTSWKQNCVMCHGGVESQTGAPPRTTWGQSGDAVRTGAHTLHATSGVTCGTCHTVPADALTDGHIDGSTATVTFGPSAIGNAGTPGFVRSAATCSGTYCHGAFKGGNTTYTPVWTTPATSTCGTCHAIPPGGTHPRNQDCAKCHPRYTATSVDPTLHLNRVVDVDGLTCSSCHGDPARQPSTDNPQLAAAPPTDTSGGADPTTRGVGVHQRHLTASAAGKAVACAECHVVPTSVAHASGAAEVVFGTVATAKGTLTPTWDTTTLSCGNTYCHSTFRHGEASNAPVWTSPRANACGTCHGVPPVTGGHPNDADCGACHTDYTATSVNAASHLNGRLDVSVTSCTGCHGDASRAATTKNPQLPAAPPVDASGNSATTAPGVGAHLAHLGAGPLSDAIACTECHVIPDLGSHPSGTVELTWGPLASAGGTTPSASGLVCTNYCHGASMQGGSLTTPVWNRVDGTQAACGTCHGLPPSAYPSASHPRYMLPAPPCAGCHPGTTSFAGNAIVAGGGGHVNGGVESTFAGHPAGWVDPTDTLCGGQHGCLPPPPPETYKHFAYYGPCTTCHGDGFEFTRQGGTSGVGCDQCHVNAFDNTTCIGMGAQPPCSCDICHAAPVVIIPR